MNTVLKFIRNKSFYIYILALTVFNGIWHLDNYSAMILTFGILLSAPLVNINFKGCLVLILIDSALKLPIIYFTPSILTFYYYYITALLVLVGAFSYLSGRSKNERYDLISNLHKIKSERADLEASLPETLNKIAVDEKSGIGIDGLIQHREDSFKNILSIIKQTFYPFSICLYFYDSPSDSFYLREHISESDCINNSALKSSESILHAVYTERRTINITRLKGSRYTIPYYAKEESIQSVLAIPLLSGRRLKGILCLDSLKKAAFSVKEEEIIRGLAKEIVKVIDSSEAMVGFSRVKNDLQNVYELATRLNRNLSVEKAVDILMDITGKIIEHDFSCFVSFDPETNKNSVVRIRSEYEDETFEGRDFACDDKLGLSSWVIKNQVPLEYCQIKGKKKEIILFNRKLKVRFKYNSVLILPVKARDVSIGAYIIASNRGHVCREGDRQTLEGIISQIGIALENAKMYDTLKHLAQVDGLTGLVNHRTFQERLSSEIARFKRTFEKFSLILTDIDHFKKFNDNYGHPIGDFVLKEISSLMGSMVRKIDIAARYGGEEFALILLNTDEAGAMKMAERIRLKVSASKFKTQDHNLKVTLSLGVATYPSNAQTEADLIDSADKALYWSKENGRNRSTHFSDIVKGIKKYPDSARPTAVN